MCQAARDLLKLWQQSGKGCMHVQSKRFLDRYWKGLHGDSDPADPPLRVWVERLANGETIAQMYDEDPTAIAPFIRWVSAFKLVTGY